MLQSLHMVGINMYPPEADEGEKDPFAHTWGRGGLSAEKPRESLQGRDGPGQPGALSP